MVEIDNQRNKTDFIKFYIYFICLQNFNIDKCSKEIINYLDEKF